MEYFLKYDTKWNYHIDQLICRALPNRYVTTLRKLKFNLSRKKLGKLYTVHIYIRSLLECACEVWENCSNIYVSKETIQSEAGRITTGLSILTKTEFIYKELLHEIC